MQVVKVVPHTEKEEVRLVDQLGVSECDLPPFVSITGGSGSGKTTVLHQIALAWALAQLDRGDSSSPTSRPDIPKHLQWVTDYQFVILLDMELASVLGEDGNICDLIRSQLISVEGVIRVGRVWRHLQDSQNKVCGSCSVFSFVWPDVL